MHIQPFNLRKKHWLLFYSILGFICLLIVIFVLINFLKWRNGNKLILTKSDINQVYIANLGNNDDEFTLQIVINIDEQFQFSTSKNILQPSPGFITNCSESICEGPLSPIYCSGPLISSAWYFGLQHQCPGTKLLYEPNEILKNFRKIIRGKVIKKGDFMQFCEENFANTDYLKSSNLTDWQPNPKNFELINDPKWKKFAFSLHQIWPLLTREFIDDVHNKQQFYPVLSVPNRFLVPGGFFKAKTNCPRSENFLEDYQLGIQSKKPLFFWSSTASACESGIDFSSRWYNWRNNSLNFNENGGEMSRVRIATNLVLPVDLNAFIAWNYWTMANLSKEIGQNE
uniref:Trehalase n=1 Tax=Meloidogyne hapla TaxID=6305 RepID=A0A1I8BUY7_MELHA